MATDAADIARHLESPEHRRRRLRLGILLLILALTAVVLAVLTAAGTVDFRLAATGSSGPGDLRLPARPAAAVPAAITLVIAVAQLWRGLSGRWAVAAFALFGCSFVMAFICWAASGKLFPLTNQIQGTLALSTPLILGALAGVLCERAGVINIAIEGQLLAGAFAAAIVATVSGSLLVGVVAALLAGVFVAWLLAVFSIRYLVNQIVLGVVLVVLATGITGFLFDQLTALPDGSARFNTPGTLQPIAVPVLSSIPIIGPTIFDQTALVYAMVVLVALITFVLYRTPWGLRVRAVGEHPRAAATVGINVLRIRYQAVLAAGVIAGLGGAYFTIGSTGGFTKEMTAGNGFIALAALIMGRWHPLGSTCAALFFGFTKALQGQLQVLATPIPTEVLQMTPYLLTVIAVAGAVGQTRPPKADGEPYTAE
ncbi:ABC transporter permease [Nocardia sp. CDC153]|uniref:ABC transporter permease n=1 Tax=Nocardia sp. CDC153 TaxID=3112167 RepID=UPI002DBD23BE|nr:ABC transporter permease [Nocardia sp. CDC153]MEC3955915.1 ABC transporter permease [Nocardia sp. CDC153]